MTAYIVLLEFHSIFNFKYLHSMHYEPGTILASHVYQGINHIEALAHGIQRIVDREREKARC